MKKKLILMCVAGILAGSAIIGGTLAGFNTEMKQQGVAQITTKSMSIGIRENNGESQKAELETAVAPGTEIPVARSIVNDAPEGYDLYTRVTIYKRWNRDGLDGRKIHLYLGDTELTMENSEAVSDTDWILWYADDEQAVMYYRKPLSENQATSEVLSSLKIAGDVNNAYAGAEVILEFDVDAVQKIAAQDAIVSEWGVYPVIDEDGSIVSISE